MYIITLPNSTVIAKTSAIDTSDQGLVINVDQNVAYGFKVNTYQIDDEDLPEDYVPYKYFYTEDKGFTKDAGYVEPVEVKDPMDVKIEALTQRIADLEDAICELSESLVEEEEEEVTE